MKRLFIFSMIFSFLLFSGCSSGAVVPQTKNISFNFTFQNGEEDFSASAQIDEKGETRFTVLSPESIEGFSMIFMGDNVKTEFLGIEKNFPINETDFGVFNKIYEAFSALEGANTEKNGGMYTAAVILKLGEEYVFTLTDLGLPISLKTDDKIIEFTDIKAK